MSRSEKFWDRAAKNYDREEMDDEPVTLKIIEMTNKYLHPSDMVMDFGCGTGLISNEISGNVKIIHAIDTSEKMIEMAKQKASDRQIENIEYMHTNLFDERFVSGSYDVILVFYVLHLFADSRQVLQRIRELLKPGGLMISATPCMGKKTLLGFLLPLLGKTGFVPYIKFISYPDLASLITNEGFEIIESVGLDESSQQYYMVGKKG